MTSNELRQIFADALDGAAERMRVGMVTAAEPKQTTDLVHRSRLTFLRRFKTRWEARTDLLTMDHSEWATIR